MAKDIYKKVYIIAGHGDYLLDFNERGISTPLILFTLDDIKRILGITE